MELKTGDGAQVAATCLNGSSFALRASASLFLDGAPCATAGTNPLDVTQGELQFSSSSSTPPPGSSAPADAGPSAIAVRTPVSQASAQEPGTSFSTRYTQANGIGTTLTTVQSGSVSVIDANTGGNTIAKPGQPVMTTGPVAVLSGAILPTSRSV